MCGLLSAMGIFSTCYHVQKKRRNKRGLSPFGLGLGREGRDLALLPKTSRGPHKKETDRPEDFLIDFGGRGGQQQEIENRIGLKEKGIGLFFSFSFCALDDVASIPLFCIFKAHFRVLSFLS